MKVRPGLEPDSEMGPLITQAHRDKVASYLESGAEQGASVVADGRELDVDGDGFFLGVSMLDGVTPEMDCYRRTRSSARCSPWFGVDTYDEALGLVNENPYGNGTAIFTRDGGVARQFQFECNAGMVGVNVPIPVPVAYYSFGGWKASLFGDSTRTAPSRSTSTRAARSSRPWPDPATSRSTWASPRRGKPWDGEAGRDPSSGPDTAGPST